MTNQTIRRDEIDEKPGISSNRKAPRVGRFVRLWLDKNLMNYPIARDVRCRAEWSLSKRDRAWSCTLPSEGRIRLLLPASTPESDRRVPTAFDVNVLFLLLARSQQAGKTTIPLGSAAAILRALGLQSRNDNRKRLWAALDLWATLTIEFRGIWYEDGQGGQDKRLPPPLAFDDDDMVRLTKRWRPIVLRDKKHYQGRVPIPLPDQAAVENAVLMILTSKVRSGFEFYEDNKKLDVYHTRSVAAFGRKCGLGKWHRRERLIRALKAAERWFHNARGNLIALVGPDTVPDGKLAFIAQRPEPGWVRAEEAGRIPLKRSRPATRGDADSPPEALEGDADSPPEEPERDANPPPYYEEGTNVPYYEGTKERNRSPTGDSTSLREYQDWDDYADPRVHRDEYSED